VLRRDALVSALAAAGLGVVLTGVAGAARSPATTGVDPLIRVSVQITDSRIFVKPKRVARMETVYFRVVNVGTKTHDFRVGGQKTRELKHGEVAHVLIQFVDRGNYVYRCAVHCDSRTMRGLIQVYSPLGG
jgi:plastocyanin